MTTQLQGIGTVPAIPARDLKPGMIIRWNFGYTALVLDVFPSDSGKTLIAVIQENGKVYNRRFSASTAIATA